MPGRPSGGRRARPPAAPGPVACSRAELTAWKRSNRAAGDDAPPAAAGPVLEAGVHAERGQDLQPGPEQRGALPAGPPDDRGAPLLGVVGGGRGQMVLPIPASPVRATSPPREVAASTSAAARPEAGRPTRPEGVGIIGPDGPRPLRRKRRGQQALMASRSWIRCTVPSETVSMK